MRIACTPVTVWVHLPKSSLLALGFFKRRRSAGEGFARWSFKEQQPNLPHTTLLIRVLLQTTYAKRPHKRYY